MIEERLAELRKEFALGQEQMAQLERKCSDLRDTLLRISGAIQVLEEMSAHPTPSNGKQAVGEREL